jgi:phosphate transport system ATP-binding protein
MAGLHHLVNETFTFPVRETSRHFQTKIEVKDLSFFYADDTQALKSVNLIIADKCVTGIIGPSGCGKSTLLRVLNRMYELYPGQRATGKVMLDNKNILAADHVESLRKRVGMVFQLPTAFPMTVIRNIEFAIGISEKLTKDALHVRAEEVLRQAGLWDEVKDRLHRSANDLSGGQQQRLSIARALANRPEVLLMDEPCSALDPIASAHIEELICRLRESFAIVLVTHNLAQAARTVDFSAFMYLGELIEFGPTETMFINPKSSRTKNYLTGRIG